MFCSEYMVDTYFCLLSWIFGMLVSFTEGDYTRIKFRSSCVLIKRSFIFLLPFYYRVQLVEQSETFLLYWEHVVFTTCSYVGGIPFISHIFNPLFILVLF